jgi:mitogen-activated protein kinase 1/3
LRNKWGIGCIFAELLAKTPEHLSDPDTIKDQPLFPGRSCFPLSPDKFAKKKSN